MLFFCDYMFFNEGKNFLVKEYYDIFNLLFLVFGNGV